jgi:hypothetical protein
MKNEQEWNKSENNKKNQKIVQTMRGRDDTETQYVGLSVSATESNRGISPRNQETADDQSSSTIPWSPRQLTNRAGCLAIEKEQTHN